MTVKKTVLHNNSPLEKIESESFGKLVAGNYTLKIGSSYGAIASLVAAQEQPNWRESPTPTFTRNPPHQQGWEDRKLLPEAIACLQSGQSVELCTPVGFANSELLVYLAQQLQATRAFPDGVIYLSPIFPDTSDLLQSLWEAFYESDIPYKPTTNQIRQQIQDKQALVVLDEDELSPEEVTALTDAASKCTFVFASANRRRLQTQGRSLTLDGVSFQEALVLAEEQLQGPLTIEEQSALISLCKILQGHPAYLRLAIACVVEDGRSLANFVAQLPTVDTGKYLIQQILHSLPQRQKNILDLLVVMGNVGLSAEQIVVITQLPKTLSMLENLCQLYLVQQKGTRYYLNAIVAEALPPAWQLTAPLEDIINYFTNWVKKHHKQTTIPDSEIDALVQVLKVALAACRWQDVLFLVKAVEGSLAFSRRWGLWEQILQWGLQASQAQKDKTSEAWILHQLGTRALCLQENSAAGYYLTKALELRVALDDKLAIAATRHNVNLLACNFQTAKNSGQDRDKDKQLPALLPPLTRIAVVTNNTSPLYKPYRRNFWFSPQRTIAVVILTSAGLLVLFNWHRFTFLLAKYTKHFFTESKTTVKPSIPSKSHLGITQKKSPFSKPNLRVTKPNSVSTVKPLPLPEVKPTIDPVLKPIFPKEPVISPRPIPKASSTSRPTYSSAPITRPTSTPSTTATPAATFTPTPAPVLEPPTLETTPTPTLTPVPTPASVLPSLQAAPKPTFTPLPTRESTTKADTPSPTSNVTVPTVPQ
jgi:hypothetical protein